MRVFIAEKLLSRERLVTPATCPDYNKSPAPVSAFLSALGLVSALHCARGTCMSVGRNGIPSWLVAAGGRVG
jgi:hypothetical protein